MNGLMRKRRVMMRRMTRMTRMIRLKKAFGVNFVFKSFSGAHVRSHHHVIVKLDEKYTCINNFIVK